MHLESFYGCVFLFLVSLSTVAHAGTVEGWPAFQPNLCKDPKKDIFIDFEEGLEGIQVSKTYPEVKFTNTRGLNWLYIDARSGSYNLNGFRGDFYAVNGNKGTWLGPSGNTGRIDFTGSIASYFSLLACAGPTGIKVRAYNADGVLLDSVSAGQNTWTDKTKSRPLLHRLTVTDTKQGGNISYVEISDSGNFWIIDDLCTDAASPCTPLEGFLNGPRDKRLDIVFLKDMGYTGSDDDFKAIVTTMITDRLFLNEPTLSNMAFFNFYTSEKLKGDSSSPGNACGPKTLPSDFYNLCPYADAVAVVHSEEYPDCSLARVFSTEADTVRSFIHEISHAAFGLRDMYDDPQCSTNYGTDNFDIYLSENACTADAKANGFPSAKCTKFTSCPLGSGGRWKINEGKESIMDDGTFFANGWAKSSQWRIKELFGNLVRKEQTGKEPASKTRSILLELQIGDDISLRSAAQVVVSTSPQFLLSSYDYIVNVTATDGTVIGSYGFTDPSSVDGGEKGYVGSIPTGPINMTLVIPYFTTASTVSISDGSKQLDVNVSQLAGLSSGTLQADAGGPYSGNVNEIITLDASASLISTENISFYEWDIGGNGKFWLWKGKHPKALQSLTFISYVVHNRHF